MKKSVLFIAALALVSVLSSCKKDWTCTCVTSEYDELIDNYLITDQVDAQKSVTRKDAEEWCNSLEIDLPGDSIVSCDLVKK